MSCAPRSGLIVQFDYLNETFPMAEEQAAIAKSGESEYWYGDFYPTQAAIGPDVLAAWQLHRADLDAGWFWRFAAAHALFLC